MIRRECFSTEVFLRVDQVHDFDEEKWSWAALSPENGDEG